MIVHFSPWEPDPNFGGGRVVLNNKNCLDTCGSVMSIYPSKGHLIYRIFLLYKYAARTNSVVVIESTRICFPFLKSAIYVEHNDEVEYLRVNSKSNLKLLVAYISRGLFRNRIVLSLFKNSRITDIILPGIYLIDLLDCIQENPEKAKFDCGIFCSLDVPFNIESIMDYVVNHWDSSQKLLVSGRRPPDKLKDFLESKGIKVEGNIENPSDFYHQIDKVIVWDLYGVGLKTRVFEALYYDKTIVLSPNLLNSYDKIINSPDSALRRAYLERNIREYRAIWQNIIER